MTIPIVRSWPNNDVIGRMRVDDELDREYVEGYDFRVLIDHYSDTGVIHLEWDMAVDWADLMTFRTRCQRDASQRVMRIIPYRLYHATTARAQHVLAHTLVPAPFGCVYLPPWILQNWRPVIDGDDRFNDTTLMQWLNTKEAWPYWREIDADLHAVHLHY